MTMSNLIFQKLQQIREEKHYHTYKKPDGRKYHERCECLAYTYSGQECGQVTDDRENLYITGKGEFFIVSGFCPLKFSRSDIIPLTPEEVRKWIEEVNPRLSEREKQKIIEKDRGLR